MILDQQNNTINGFSNKIAELLHMFLALIVKNGIFANFLQKCFNAGPAVTVSGPALNQDWVFDMASRNLLNATFHM